MRRHQAVANVDAAVNHATKPARTLGEVFDDLKSAYVREGFGDEWQLHHQGGSTGYANREVVATPDSNVRVRENQAFAWNPSITGTKSEDTVLVTSNGIEVLTSPSSAWPTIRGRSLAGDLIRVVELGLVYACDLEPTEDGRRKASIRMTLTAPGCGMGDILVEDVRTKVERVPTISEADVELVLIRRGTRP